MATQAQDLQVTSQWSFSRLVSAINGFWERSMATALSKETDDGYMSRLLSGMLLALMSIGILGEALWLNEAGKFISLDSLPVLAILFLAVFYLLNKMGHFRLAAIGTIYVLVVAIYASLLASGDIETSASVLIYLVLPILVAAFFLKPHVYTWTVFMSLFGLLFFLQAGDIVDVFTFLLIFSTLLGVFKHHYRLLEQKRNWKLVESHQDLTAAYDATIAGWSNAMDLRDKETEGHSVRVTQLAIQVASILGISDEEQVHIHRGALLHDIGKLGIPDSILHKPEPLTDEEWGIMRQHPTFALNMLSQISYLQCALEIPYSHHERWDGSGYPLGLKGEQIPLAARVFAVVDVWDALTSDRPYRPAWPERRAIVYIREQAGKLFDPKVVGAFLALMKQAAKDSGVTASSIKLMPKFVTSPLPEIPLRESIYLNK